MTCVYLDMFNAVSSITADAATELQVSNSRLAEVEAAFTAQKSEVRFSLYSESRVKAVCLSHHRPFWLVIAGKAQL